MTDKRKMEAAAGQRVFEYRDDDGVIYYSFTRSPNIISPPTRLKMKGRVGTHITNFLVRLRRISELSQATGRDGG